jgi:uncharacterized protein (TIGR02246 family)
MKTCLLGALVGLAISFALPTFAQQKETVDPQVMVQISAISKKYDEAFNNNDAAALAAFFTEDAVFVTDTGRRYGRQAIGRQAIEKQYAEWFKGGHASDHIGYIPGSSPDPNSTRFLGTTDNVMTSGEYSVTWQAQGQKPFHQKGYWTAIDTRVGDAWKVRMLTYNITPAPAAPAETK